MENEAERAIKYLLKVIKIKDFSEKELFEKLANKGYSDKAAEKAVKHLKESGLIDNRKFAAGLVRRFSDDKPTGKYIIMKKLKDKGIQQDDFEPYLKDINELDLARKYIQKKLYKIKGKTGEEAKKFIYRSLMSRGFSYDSVEKILNEYSGGTLLEQQ